MGDKPLSELPTNSSYVLVTVGKSSTVTKCVESSEPVQCQPDAASKGNRESQNVHKLGDFEVETSEGGKKVCVTHTSIMVEAAGNLKKDSKNVGGWQVNLRI